MSVHNQRERTKEQLQAVDILRRLDPDGEALRRIQEFVRETPVGRSVELASALASWCEKKEKPALALIGAIRGGYARDVAEGIAETRARRRRGSDEGLAWQDIHDTYGHPKQLSDFEYKRRMGRQRRWLDARRFKETHWGQEYSFVPEWTPQAAEACYSEKQDEEGDDGRGVVSTQRGGEEGSPRDVRGAKERGEERPKAQEALPYDREDAR